LPGGPRPPALEVAEERVDLLRRRLDQRPALHLERVGLERRDDQHRGEREDDDGEDDLQHGQRSIATLKPPKNMRLPANGNFFGAIMFATRGSFIAFLLTRSRCARFLYIAHDSHTTSPFLSFTACGNDVTLPGLTSSPMDSV